MSTQTAPRHDGIGPELSEYDLLLTAIPLPLAGSLLAGAGVGLPSTLAAGVGSVLSVVLVGYAMFVAAPTTGGAGDDDLATGSNRGS